MKNFMSQLGLNNEQQDGEHEGNQMPFAPKAGHMPDGDGGPLFLNNPASGSQENETESAFNARTQHKHQQNQEYMLNIRQVGYNKQKMKIVSYPNEEDEQEQENLDKNAENEEDFEAIDVTKLNPMRSSRHVFVSHLIRIDQIEKGTLEPYGESNFQQQLMLELQQTSENQMKNTFQLQNDQDQMAEALSQVLNDNEDPQHKQLIELLKNIGPEDLQNLADNGFDLKNLSNIDDLNNLMQYCESIGGAENLFQALQQIQDQEMNENEQGNMEMME